jgi:hypothetical protein
VLTWWTTGRGLGDWVGRVDVEAGLELEAMILFYVHVYPFDALDASSTLKIKNKYQINVRAEKRKRVIVVVGSRRVERRDWHAPARLGLSATPEAIPVRI